MSAPATFAEAGSRRARARTAGLAPDYWYAVEYADRVKPGQVVEVRYWHRSIALFRTADGALHAVDNRCAHRQVKLSLGTVDGDCLTCPYHGWSYDGAGRLARIPHDLFGHAMPSIRLRSYPVRERYGLVWIFPGDPALAGVRHIPDIPELEGPDRWTCVPLDFRWRAHHSMIIDNVSDFTHAWLHRRYRPFSDATLTHLEAKDDYVRLSYDTQIGMGAISSRFVDRRRVNTTAIDLGYEYPYQWSSTDGTIKHWCFLLPEDARTTRVFFLFYFESLAIPMTSWRIPRPLMPLVMRLANRWLIGPLLAQDGFAVEAEQRAWDEHAERPMPDLNPAIGMFHQLTVRKWEEHLARPAASSSPS